MYAVVHYFRGAAPHTWYLSTFKIWPSQCIPTLPLMAAIIFTSFHDFWPTFSLSFSIMCLAPYTHLKRMPVGLSCQENDYFRGVPLSEWPSLTMRVVSVTALPCYTPKVKSLMRLSFRLSLTELLETWLFSYSVVYWTLWPCSPVINNSSVDK